MDSIFQFLVALRNKCCTVISEIYLLIIEEKKMSLKLNEWHKLTKLEKISFVVELTAPIALIVTIIFSWLTLSEARKATELQAKLFAAQNAPNLKVVDYKIIHEKIGDSFHKKGFLVDVENVGGSKAKQVCLKVGNQINRYLYDYCGPERLSVGIGSRFSAGFIPFEAMDSLGFGKICELEPIENIKEFDHDKLLGPIHLTVYFEDIFRNKFNYTDLIYFFKNSCENLDGFHTLGVN